MTRDDTVGERVCEGEEEMARELGHGFLVANSYKRATSCTPPPTWRLEFSPLPSGAGISAAVESKEFLTTPVAAEVSARKLCAHLWEIEQLQPPIIRRKLRKLRRSRRRDKAEEGISNLELPCNGPPHGYHHQPLSTGSPRKQMAAKFGHTMQPATSAAYSSSMEVAAYKPAVTLISTDSLDLKSPSCSLKTSTKLLRVLNRIWSLEEQHAANTTLVKALKTELDQCREEIKELQREKRMEGECNNKLVKEKKKQEKLGVALQCVKDELEGERKLRRQSEDLQRKLGQELCEVKHCYAKSLKEFDRERRTRVLLENLCDQFAEAVKAYEDEVRRLRRKAPGIDRRNTDRLIVQVAETWLDERFSMKLEEDKEDFMNNNSAVDKIGHDLETFLETKRINVSRKEKESRSWRSFDPSKSSSRKHGGNSQSGAESADSDHEKQRVASKLLNPLESYDFYRARRRSGRCPERDEMRKDNQMHVLRSLCGRRSEAQRMGLLDHQAIHRMIRNHHRSVSSEGDKIHPKSDSPEEDVDVLKEETLHAKLMEARLESRRLRSRS